MTKCQISCPKIISVYVNEEVVKENSACASLQVTIYMV